MNKKEKLRFDAGINLLKLLSEETSVIAKPLSQVDVKHIPNNVEPAIRNWIRTQKNHEVYGSAAMRSHSIIARQPADLDLVIQNPKAAAYAMANIMRKKGIKVKVVSDPKWDSHVVKVFKNGEWNDAIDVHPIAGHFGALDVYGESKPGLVKKDIRIQRAYDQLLRKANSILSVDPTTKRMGPVPARELKDTIDFVTTSKLLIASKKTKSGAEYKRALEAEKELKVWIKHLKGIKDDKAKKKIVKQKQISKTRKQQFTTFSLQKPSISVDDIIFEKDTIKVRKKRVKPTIKLTKTPYSLRPYSNPYHSGAKKRVKKIKRGRR